LKHFKIVGPETTKEFDIEGDEMMIFNIIKIINYDKKLFDKKLCSLNCKIQNEKFTITKKEKLD